MLLGVNQLMEKHGSMILISITIKPNSTEGTKLHNGTHEGFRTWEEELLPFANDILNGFADKR